MRLGLSSYALTWTIHADPNYNTPLRLLEVAAQHGATLVQICDNLPLSGLSERELGELRVAGRDLGIGVEVGLRGLTLENARRHLSIARQLDAPLLRAVIDGAEYEPHPEEVVALLQDLDAELQDGGVTLGIENHDRFKARTIAEMVRAANSNLVGVCLDTVNSLGASEGLEEVVTTLAPHTVNLHVKDYRVTRLAPLGLGFLVEGAPAGQGVVDWGWVLDQLSPEVTLSLELWPPSQATLAETVTLEQAWLKSSMAYLQELLHRRAA
jgi:sugar phosphate isomerase/epimerase